MSQAASSVPAFNSAQPSACPLRTIVLVGNEHLVLDLADYRRALIVPAVDGYSTGRRETAADLLSSVITKTSSVRLPSP